MNAGIADRHAVWIARGKKARRIRAFRAGNVVFYKKRNPAMYEQMLNRLISETGTRKMIGEWNDYGRLIEEK